MTISTKLHIPPYLTLLAGLACLSTACEAAFNDAEGIEVQASVDHRVPGNFDAVTVWVEDLTTEGVELCVRETSQFNDAHINDGLHVSYWAYRSTKAAIRHGRADMPYIPTSGGQRACATINYGQDFSLAPIVHATLTPPYTGAPYAGQDRDASSLWLEWVHTDKFKVCMRETANGTAGHVAFAIDWVAFLPGDEPDTSDSRSGIIDVADELVSGQWKEGASKRQTPTLAEFAEEFLAYQATINKPGSIDTKRTILELHRCPRSASDVSIGSTSGRSTPTRSRSSSRSPGAGLRYSPAPSTNN